MANPFESGQKTVSQERLRASLEAGTIDRAEFIKKVFELDQSTSAREQSLANVELLESPGIIAAFIGSEYETQYYSALTLSHFHAAQYSAYLRVEGVTSHFEAALISELHVPDSQDFLAYIKATVAYQHGNLEVLRTEQEQVTDPKNALIVGKLLRDLEEFGSPDYVRAVSRP